ncbi:MAG TPA: hypothetical protein VHQ24_09590 [Lachnospiraceae bacterium]|nr:hypothetical protein [Lachnospiraceae bacterium]
MRKGCPLKYVREASYTLEAAFVVPIVFFIVIFFLNYSFYSYDRSKLQSELNDIMRKASAYMAYEVDLYLNEVIDYKLAERNFLSVWFEDRSLKEQVLKEYIKNRLASKYYITSVESITVETTPTKVRVAGIANMRFPVLWFATGAKDYSFEVDFSQEVSMFPREEKARIMTAVIELGTNIKGVDKLLSAVSKFIDQVH